MRRISSLLPKPYSLRVAVIQDAVSNPELKHSIILSPILNKEMGHYFSYAISNSITYIILWNYYMSRSGYLNAMIVGYRGLRSRPFRSYLLIFRTMLLKAVSWEKQARRPSHRTLKHVKKWDVSSSSGKSRQWYSSYFLHEKSRLWNMIECNGRIRCQR